MLRCEDADACAHAQLKEGSSTPRTLRARRVEPDAVRFRPRFYEESPLFWPIAEAASAFRDDTDWPPVEEYARAFGARTPPIAFELALPKPRRARRAKREAAREAAATQASQGAQAAQGPQSAVDVRALYDGRISLTKRVPTRARSWHDFLNALVWATFPAAKAALHARQYAAMSVHVPADATRLPNARTRELDALALLDEGGVIVTHGEGLPRRRFIFGHALFEGLVLGGRAMIARTLVVPELPNAGSMPIDEVLAAILGDTSRPLVPEVLPRIALACLENDDTDSVGAHQDTNL